MAGTAPGRGATAEPPTLELVLKRNGVERLKREKSPLGMLDELPAPPDEYAVQLTRGVEEHHADVDELLRKFSEHWALERMPAVDRAVILAFHDATAMAQPGPLAPQGWFADSIAALLARLDPAKVVLAVGGMGSDWTDGAPFPREKGTLYDGGTREPLLLSWPGVIRPGTVYDQAPVGLVDLMPSLLEVAGLTPDSLVQGRSLRTLLTAPESYTPQDYVFTERNWHDCDEHQRAVRDGRWKLIRTDAYTSLPLCTAADIGASPSFLALRKLARAGRLTTAQRRLFEAPRARVELYDLQRDPWELTNLADDPAQAARVRRLAEVLQAWMEETDDFPAAWRVRDDHTDRITGVQFGTSIPPLRNPVPPPPDQRWGTPGP